MKITSRPNFDLDGFAAIFCYSHYLESIGENVAAVYPSSGDIDCQFLCAKLNLQITVTPSIVADEKEQYIFVDDSDPSHLPAGIKPEQVVEVIDHRLFMPIEELQKQFPNAKIEIQILGAASTIIYWRLKKLGYQFSQTEAFLIYSAILINSMNLVAPNTTDLDKDACRELEAAFGFDSKIYEELNQNKQAYFQEHTKEVMLSELKPYAVGDLGINYCQVNLEGLAGEIGKLTPKIKEILSELSSKDQLENPFFAGVDPQVGHTYFIFATDVVRELVAKVVVLEQDPAGYDFAREIVQRKLLMKLLLAPLDRAKSN